MGKTFLKVGLFIFALIFIANSGASFAANSDSDLNIINDPLKFNIINVKADKQTDKAQTAPKVDKKVAVKPKPRVKKAPKPAKYIIKSGDSLTKIANHYKTTWQRLFYKNTKITNPDSINPGEAITIPLATEKLAKRTINKTVPKLANTITNVSQSAQKVIQPKHSQPRGSSAGNTYTPGYCTWYAKNRRPDLPNMLGNASSWVSSAAAQGIPTGNTPRAGAIGQQGNHVVYVEKVNSNGTVSVSEMNYGGGLFVVHRRTVPASSFMYIY